MPKEKSINPAQAERKKEKAKAVKKGKAEAASRRTEKLARRNPERLQKQVDELKALESSGGKLTSHEQKVLDELERDLKAVRKARDTLGTKAPALRRDSGSGGGFGDGGRGGGVLGKRRRYEGAGSGSGSESDVPDDVKAIPMPRDTPPPVPKEVLDKWYQARRERHQQYQRQEGARGAGTNANNTPLGGTTRVIGRASDEADAMMVQAPAVEAKTVYEAAPEIRDLRREAVSAFLPAAVRLKMEKAKGKGGLVEPEEADALEREGYLGGGGEKAAEKDERTGGPRAVMMEEVEDDDDYQ